jgi:valyl-tRNA synthetase
LNGCFAMLDKTFEPGAVERDIYAAWEQAGAFKAGAGAAPEADTFTIVIPPPNVTGSLHMGHALNNTLQDILIRYHRMRGFDTLWQPGTDHAGIATQMVVERQLAEEGNIGRREMGREDFVKRVWAWKEESGGTIKGQLTRLGASCDWSRERFTMDEGLSRAVLKVFVDLYRKGLIYRGKRLVNWDPQFETAISDLEVENVEIDGHMWHFKYPLAGGEAYEYVEKDEDGNVTLRETRDYISIATTRPETMLGDGAVAVHPSDERYAPIVGKLCEIPVGPKDHRRLIPIITDEYPDPEFGSGAVKITGAHDFNDYAVANRNDIPKYRLMDTRAQMRADGAPYEECAALAQEIIEGRQLTEAEIDEINLVPDDLRGLDRYEARERVIDQITTEGLAVMTSGEDGEPVALVENKKIMAPFGDRSKVVIEPMLTDQWFVDAETLAKPAIEAVRKGDTKFVPANWDKTYFNWLENVEPWCISRQLWWGHQIPVWYDEDDNAYCAETEEEAAKLAGGKTLTRDPDVLDTWFSSALWPFSTLGWPDETPELQRYYKTDVLITGFDIIFFWVARMMMTGIEFRREVPFHTVYINSIVVDAKGKKMSKSQGNVIDPLETIDRFGADALRFTLASQEVQGRRQLRLSERDVEGGRNFATKLWNSCRFAEINGCRRVEGFDPAALTQTLNRWIVGEVQLAAEALDQALAAYRFNDAAGALYRFIWNTYCDWYLELAKPILTGEAGAAQEETRVTVAWARDEILKLLHPVMPFVTEELWRRVDDGAARDNHLILSRWPAYSGLVDPHAKAEIDWVIELISGIRSARAEINVPAAAKVPLVFVNANGTTTSHAKAHEAALTRLARLEGISFADNAPEASIQVVTAESSAALPLTGVIDFDAEKQRLVREIAKIDDEVGKIDKKLGNEKFLANAPDDVVAEQRARLAEAQERRGRLDQALSMLGG